MTKLQKTRRFFNYVKTERCKILIMIVGFLSYGFFLTTLVTTFNYYIILLALSLVICLLRGSFKKVVTSFEKATVFFRLYLMLYFVFFSILFFASKFVKLETFIVPINSYSTAKTDAIYFSFCNNKFKRYHDLSGLPLDKLKLNYNVELSLSMPLPHIYFIHHIDVLKKRE